VNFKADKLTYKSITFHDSCYRNFTLYINFKDLSEKILKYITSL